MYVYWFLFNPLVRDLMNIVFGILLLVGVGLFIFNLVMLVFSYRRMGSIIGKMISLFIIDVSVNWEWSVFTISQIMEE